MRVLIPPGYQLILPPFSPIMNHTCVPNFMAPDASPELLSNSGYFTKPQYRFKFMSPMGTYTYCWMVENEFYVMTDKTWCQVPICVSDENPAIREWYKLTYGCTPDEIKTLPEDHMYGNVKGLDPVRPHQVQDSVIWYRENKAVIYVAPYDDGPSVRPFAWKLHQLFENRRS